jgi:GNAT superfamily N-acetyltransferase
LDIEIRDARPSDKLPLMSFIKDVWGGHDYIPSVWDSWIGDRKAKLIVVEVDGKQVGLSRMRFLPDGVGWLEGARIHPDYRRRGLASMMGEHLIQTGLGRGVGSYRLTSGSQNRAAHAQVKKAGFVEKARVSVYEPEGGARFKAQSGVWKAEADECSEIQSLLEESREYRLGARVYWDVFSAVTLTPDVLATLVRQGSVFRTEEGVAIGRIGGEGGEIWRQICFVTGSPDGVTKLAKHIFGKKEESKTDRKLAYMPQGSPHIRTLKKLGLKRAWSLVLFEKNTSKS